MTINYMEHGEKKTVEVVKKINQGLHITHNHDGRFQKMWALGVDGRIYRTTSRGQYRPMQAAETAPAEIQASMAAQTMGRLGGVASTPAKTEAVRANGKLGGRPRDQRRWKLISDYIGNDPSPYTTKQLFDFADQCNRENANDPDWTPFQLVDAGDEIHDLSHQRGNEGFIAAVRYPADK